MKHVQLFTRHKFFVSYLVIFFITVIIFSYFINENINILRKNLYEINNASLEQSSSLIISRFTEVLNLMNMIINNRDIQHAIQCENPIKPEYVSNTLELINLRKTLSDYMAANDFIDQIILYNKDENFLITSKSIYLRPMYMSSINFLHQIDIFAETVFKMVDLSVKCNEFIPIVCKEFGKNKNYIMVINKFSSTIDSYAVIMINSDKLDRYFSSNIETGNFYILDKDGKILYSSESLFYIDKSDLESLYHHSSYYNLLGQEYIISKIESTFKNLTFMSIIPSKKVLNDIYIVERTAIITLLISFCIVLVISILLTKFNYKPIKNLIKSLIATTGKTPTSFMDEFAIIEEQFNFLIKHNLQEQSIAEGYVRKSFFFELLNGKFYDEQQINSYIKSLHINIPTGLNYAVLLCRFNLVYSKNIDSNIESLNLLKTEVIRKVEQYISDLVSIIDTNYNSLSIIIGMKENNEKVIADAAHKIFKEIFDYYDIKLTFALSNWTKKLTELSAAYSNAISALDQAVILDNQYFIIYSESEGYINNIYFPTSIQLKLTNAVLSTRLEKIDEILNNLFNKNIYEFKISISSFRLLYYSLCTCLVDLANRLNSIPQELVLLINGCINSSDASNQDFKLLIHCFKEISRRFSLEKDELKESIKKRILAYIDENCYNNDLSLTMVAEKFNLSEPYISTLIKEATELSFITYVTNKRIEYAMELLRKTNYTIEQIAEETGYNSPNSFRKAFKKVTGQSPTNYKRINI